MLVFSTSLLPYSLHSSDLLWDESGLCSEVDSSGSPHIEKLEVINEVEIPGSDRKFKST